MLHPDRERIYSASDPMSFLECEHSTTLALALQWLFIAH